MPVFSLADPQFWFQFFRYCIAVIFAYFIPGDLFVSRLSLPRIFRIPLSIVIGMVFLGYESIIAGYFHVRCASVLYIILCCLLWLIQQKFRKKERQPYKVDRISVIFVIIGSCALLTTIWFTGLMHNGLAVYCCSDSNDTLYYGAISQQIVRHFPPDHPGMTGIELKNYHYWSNIIVAETARIFHLPVFQLQFQYSTVFLSLLLGFLIIGLCWEIGGSSLFCRWVLFFFYFGGDAIYWFIALTRSGPIFSMSSLEDGIGFFGNYPRAMAVVVSLAAMMLLFHLRKRFSYSLVFVTGMVFASLSGMKIYIGFFCYVGLMSLMLYEMLRYRRSATLLVGIVSVIFLLPLYFLVNTGAGNLYYSGFWRAENFIAQPNLPLIRFEMARRIFETDKKWMYVLIYDLFFSFLYFVLIFGTKIIAVFNTKKSYRQVLAEFHYFVIPAILVSSCIGFFFNQDTGGANSFNFIVSSYIYISFYAALFCAYSLRSSHARLRGMLILLIILFTLPRACFRVYKNIDNIIHQNGFSLSSNVLEASERIRESTNPDDTMLIDFRSFPWDTPGPAFSMFLDRPMYISGESILMHSKALHGEIEKRKGMRAEILSRDDTRDIAPLLIASGVRYVITDPNHSLDFMPSSHLGFFSEWYRNPDVLILKIRTECLQNLMLYEESTGCSLR